MIKLRSFTSGDAARESETGVWLLFEHFLAVFPVVDFSTCPWIFIGRGNVPYESTWRIDLGSDRAWALVPRAPLSRDIICLVGKRLIFKFLSLPFLLRLLLASWIWIPLLPSPFGLCLLPWTSKGMPVTLSCRNYSGVSILQQWGLLSFPWEAPIVLFVCHLATRFHSSSCLYSKCSLARHIWGVLFFFLKGKGVIFWVHFSLKLDSVQTFVWISDV